MPEDYVLDAACKERSGEILREIRLLNNRLFRDNGTISHQTRLDRHEQALRMIQRIMYGVIAAVLLAVGDRLLQLIMRG